MEKISRILPPSRRVTATDVESNQPVRPGAPEFGRPSRKSLDVEDRLNFSSVASNRSAEAATYKNPKEGARAKAIDDLAEKFFNPKTVAKEGEGVQSEEMLKKMEDTPSFTKLTPETSEPISKDVA
jgi:hypothetical protein